MNFLLFYTDQCYNCPSVKKFMFEQKLEGDFINASQSNGMAKAKQLGVQSVPTVIFFKGKKEMARANSLDECRKVITDEY